MGWMAVGAVTAGTEVLPAAGDCGGASLVLSMPEAIPMPRTPAPASARRAWRLLQANHMIADKGKAAGARLRRT